MGALDEKVIEGALEKAEEAARRAIEGALGSRSPRYSIQLSVVYDERGLVRLTAEISVSRPHIDERVLGEVVEAAIAAAERAFESEVSVALGGGAGRRGEGVG